MSRDSTNAKIEFIIKMISNIETIISRHGSVTKVIEDDVEAKPAMLMALMQIGESMRKIDSDVLKRFDLDVDTKGAYNVRNFIAHDYDGIDLGLIETILRDKVPELKAKMQKLADEFLDDKNIKD
jgi:uncharacterized protein with HEPN domain